MTGSMFCFCPHCGSDLRGETKARWLLSECPQGCGKLEHYSRLIPRPTVKDATAWQCPDCGERWER